MAVPQPIDELPLSFFKCNQCFHLLGVLLLLCEMVHLLLHLGSGKFLPHELQIPIVGGARLNLIVTLLPRTDEQLLVVADLLPQFLLLLVDLICLLPLHHVECLLDVVDFLLALRPILLHLLAAQLELRLVGRSVSVFLR